MLSAKEKKRLYDIEYRRKNRELLKEKKRLYYQSPAGRVTQKRNRQKMKDWHRAYCNTPEQIQKEKEREKKRRHGEYRECFELIRKIQKIVAEVYPDRYERLKARGYVFNKAKKRSNPV